MADATITSATAAVKADVAAVESKVVTFVKAHAPAVIVPSPASPLASSDSSAWSGS